MKKQITIQVTREHIKRGRSVEEDNCPIALAFNDALPLYEAYVDQDSVMLFSVLSQGAHDIKLPKRASAFVSRVDFWGDWLRCLFCRPFAFTVDVPEALVAAEPKRSQSPRVATAVAAVLQEKEVEALV